MLGKSLRQITMENVTQRKRLYSMANIRNFIKEYLVNIDEQAKIAQIFNYIEERFSCAPASTKYHSNYAGGLLDHTVIVTSVAVDMAELFCCDTSKEIESIVKCCLLHDIGKIGTKTEDMYLLNPDESKKEKEPYIFNEKLVQLPHEDYSIKLCLDFGISLSDEEFQAILYHNLHYKIGTKDDLRFKECPLTLIVHTADNLTAKIYQC